MGTELPPWWTTGGRVALAMARVPNPRSGASRSLDTRGLYTDRPERPVLLAWSSDSMGTATRARPRVSQSALVLVSHGAGPAATTEGAGGGSSGAGPG